MFSFNFKYVALLKLKEKSNNLSGNMDGRCEWSCEVTVLGGIVLDTIFNTEHLKKIYSKTRVPLDDVVILFLWILKFT